MSQYIFYGLYESNTVRVLIGWDRPCQRHYMVIENSENVGDDYLYSNLYCDDKDMNLDNYFSVLKDKNISYPCDLEEKLKYDKDVNRGNFTSTFDCKLQAWTSDLFVDKSSDVRVKEI